MKISELSKQINEIGHVDAIGANWLSEENYNVSVFGAPIIAHALGPLLLPMVRFCDDAQEIQKIHEMTDYSITEYDSYPIIYDISRNTKVIWCSPHLRKICEKFIGYYKAGFIDNDHTCRYYFKSPNDLMKFVSLIN